VLVFALLFAVQTAPAPDDGVVRGRKLDMTTVDVRGELVRPSMATVYGKPKGHRKNLIELRASFRPELSQTPDRLR
jgi:hypothetical protein